MSKQSKLLIITNLHPVPWAPNRASFNAQQFARLAEHFSLATIVLVPWLEWLRHRAACRNSDSLIYLPYFYIPKIGRRLSPLFQLLALKLRRRWISRFAPDVVLASWGYPDAVAVLNYFKHSKLPCFIKVHGTDINENIHYPKRRRQLLAAMQASAGVFCPSKALAALLTEHGLAAERVSTVYNGVDKTIFYPGEKRANQLVFVGSIIKTKGVLELYDAFRLLHQQRPELCLTFIGEGGLRKELMMKAQADGIAAQLQFTGSLPLVEVAAAIRSAQLLLLPSYREGLPNVILEAFASGTPVVASRVGGIPEIVTEQSGVLCEDLSVEALLEAMQQALQKQWDYPALGEFAKGFDWQHNARLVAEKLTLAMQP